MFNTDMVLYFMTHYCESGKFPRKMVDTNISTGYGKMRLSIRFESIYGGKTRTLEKLLSEGSVCTNVNQEFSLTDISMFPKKKLEVFIKKAYGNISIVDNMVINV